MQATQDVMASMGLAKGHTSKKRSSNLKTEAQKLIPPKKGKGRRTAAEERSVAWIVAASESFSVRQEEREEILPVICLPCLSIKFEERIEKATVIQAPDFTIPPVSAESVAEFKETIMGVRVTPLRSSSPAPAPKKTPVRTPSQNGVANNTPVLESPESKSTTQDESDLDKDLTAWMRAAFSRYIALAGQKPNSGRTWGYRMAQVACGFDVMAQGKKWAREFFPYFASALFEMLDGAKSTLDLDLLEYIRKDSVYLDILAEAAEFQTKNGTVSVNFEHYYEDKYLAFSVADELLRGRSRS